MVRGLFVRKLKDFAEEQREISENHTLLQRLLEDMKLRPAALPDAEIGNSTKRKNSSIDVHLIY